VSNLYLVRHGQAGTRDAYDSLSGLGRRQCQLLGQYFRAQEINFAAGYCGDLCRHQQTARELSAAYGSGFPEIEVDSSWNEFDLDRLYREIGPPLFATSEEMRRQYESMRQQLRACGGDQAAPVHRRWLPCDTAVVNAWIRNEYPYAGESWEQFRQRVASCLVKVTSARRHENIAVFSSATPIAIWTGLALDLADERVMKLAGVLHNASFTILQVREAKLRLFEFNATPHLVSRDLRTFR
jgi:broad specificity phosphatase PhoE